jgi:hypothetical protein
MVVLGKGRRMNSSAFDNLWWRMADRGWGESADTRADVAARIIRVLGVKASREIEGRKAIWHAITANPGAGGREKVKTRAGLRGRSLKPQEMGSRPRRAIPPKLCVLDSPASQGLAP